MVVHTLGAVATGIRRSVGCLPLMCFFRLFEGAEVVVDALGSWGDVSVEWFSASGLSHFRLLIVS